MKAGDYIKETRFVAISTLGCRSNQYDSSALEDLLRDRGNLEVVPFPGPADAYIINTCTVTGRTDYRSRQIIRRVRKLNPGAIIIVTGCYAQVSPEEIKSIEGVDYVLGNPQKAEVLEYLRMGRQKEVKTFVGPYEDGTPLTLKARSSSGRTRANLKVQEGCNRSCSYCIIPRARGISKSVRLEEVEREIDSLVEKGFKEVVLTGIHLGAYGEDLASELRLSSILHLIEKKDYPCRFRLSSLDPDEVTEELTEILKGAKKICNHLHLPLQSGDDTIIKKMRRPYTGALFAEKVLRVSREVPEVSIGVDVIAGFPGEGEREFENTFTLLRDLPVSYIHIFPFSKRRGTAAAAAEGQVAPNVINERCGRLQELDKAKREGFYKGFIDKNAEVLVELARDKKTRFLRGRARNYIPVLFDGPDELKNTVTNVLLKGFNSVEMSGAFFNK